MGQDGRVVFKIHDKVYSVGSEISRNTSLNEFIRNHANLKGTKFMCYEGGCGACTVAVKKTNPVTHNDIVFSVNSCLIPVFACHGWCIETAECIGNRNIGYHKVQATLAGFNGTQCGYCSPGMVMNMYSLLASKEGSVTMEEVENSFGGNICRCTGYRPILDAFKSLAIDAPENLKQKCADIEDLTQVICKKTNRRCDGTCNGNFENEYAVKKSYDIPKLEIQDVSLSLEWGTGSKWYKVTSIEEIYKILKFIKNGCSYMLLAGNTAHGVYRIKENIDVCIDVNGIADLQKYVINDNGSLMIGANMSLSEAMKIFKLISAECPKKFSYLKPLADHIDLIANVAVRNVATLAGNLSIKHTYKEFPSDLFLILEAVSATLTIGYVSGDVKEYSLQEYLQMDMRKRVIHNIILPPYSSEDYIFRSFKIMQRAQNTHAYVNAAFMVKIDKTQKYIVLEKPAIVFGGITASFIHANKTEEFLLSKSLLDENILKSACGILMTEIQPDDHPPEASPKYRQLLAVSLFYKFVLGLSPDSVSSINKSGGWLLKRPLSTGKQDYQTDKSLWPLTQPIPKLEALVQCAGEAEYVNDIPVFPNELYGAFVLADRGPGIITSIDTTEAMAVPGAVTFLSAKDIPGKNTFVEVDKVEDEKLFADKEILCAGQTVGVIIAKSRSAAIAAADKVKVNIQMSGKSYTDFMEIVDENVTSRIKQQTEHKAKKLKSDVQYQIKGTFVVRGQYHFTLETQSCLCVPVEDGLDVYPASQYINAIHINISEALLIPQNSINVKVKRIGGGYGCKLGRSALVATACAVAAYNLKVPVRMVLPLEVNMEAIGKRFPLYARYEVGVNKVGEVQNARVDLYTDYGSTLNDSLTGGIILHMNDLYDTSAWNIQEHSVVTNLASNTYCRSPGSTEGIAVMENIMEHIAAVTGQDPLAIRLLNLKPKDKVMPSLVNDIKSKSDFENRKKEIEDFNKVNRWKKRGMATVIMSYPFSFWGNYHILLSVYANDGTVAITHGGIEMGQGINTKVAQVCSHILGIDVSYIKVKSSNTLTAPNNMCSGGSMASDGVCYAAIQCCKILLERLKPIRRRSKSTPWEELIKEAKSNDVDLCCEYMYAGSKVTDVKEYSIFGVTVTEVEVDMLTGQHQILRVDLLEDVGHSMSPEVDIGQVEGAFVMGLGYWLNEKLVYDKDTGYLLTNRTWNYTPPGAKDIPADFRVYFRRDAPNPFGVLRSKATGEPPLCMSVSVIFAIRNAIASARKDADDSDQWFPIHVPYTPENVLLSCMTQPEQFTL